MALLDLSKSGGGLGIIDRMVRIRMDEGASRRRGIEHDKGLVRRER
jgi:hypothetical protein